MSSASGSRGVRRGTEQHLQSSMCPPPGSGRGVLTPYFTCRYAKTSLLLQLLLVQQQHGAGLCYQCRCRWPLGDLPCGSARCDYHNLVQKDRERHGQAHLPLLSTPFEFKRCIRSPPPSTSTSSGNAGCQAWHWATSSAIRVAAEFFEHGHGPSGRSRRSFGVRL